ncbi:MAG: hypothetical protein HYY41_05845 [Chloroflexi bacterium]|nr:hypothetical protein [Chloroflexota bacterium]
METIQITLPGAIPDYHRPRDSRCRFDNTCQMRLRLSIAETIPGTNRITEQSRY